VLAICGGAIVLAAGLSGPADIDDRAERAAQGTAVYCTRRTLLRAAVLVVVASAFFDSAFNCQLFQRCASLPREHHNQLNKSRQDKNKTICISFFPCIASSVHCFFLLK